MLNTDGQKKKTNTQKFLIILPEVFIYVHIYIYMYTDTQVENILNKIDMAYTLQTGNWLPAPCHPPPPYFYR